MALDRCSSLSFLAGRKKRRVEIPLGRCPVYNDRATYRDARRRCEIAFDQAAVPLSWDSTYNQWKHLLGAKVGVEATFVQSGKYQHRSGEWHLVKWETPVPSRIEALLRNNIAEQID